MNRRVLSVLSFIAAIGLLAVLLFRDELSQISIHAESALAATLPQDDDNAKAPAENANSVSAISSVGKNKINSNPVYIKSLKTMVQILKKASNSVEDLRGLYQALQTSRQEPILAKNKNPYTGEMVVIRTKSPLPGTRYFHGQFFEASTGGHYIQHMSFEFKPSPQALGEANAVLLEAFPGLGEPIRQSDSMIVYRLNDKYNLWMKVLGADELQDSPLNAYGPEDVGSVRVALEMEVH